MDRFTRFWLLLILGMLPGLTEAAEPTTPLQNMQIHANRATSSLLLYRGEGFQKAHLLRLEDDLRALNAALMQVPNPTSALRESHQELLARLREGASFGTAEDDMPWGFPLQMSKALRDFLTAVRASRAPTARPNCRPRSNTLPCNTSAAPISAPSKSPANSRIPTSARMSATWCRPSTLSSPSWTASATRC